MLVIPRGDGLVVMMTAVKNPGVNVNSIVVSFDRNLAGMMVVVVVVR